MPVTGCRKGRLFTFRTTGPCTFPKHFLTAIVGTCPRHYNALMSLYRYLTYSSYNSLYFRPLLNCHDIAIAERKKQKKTLRKFTHNGGKKQPNFVAKHTWYWVLEDFWRGGA